jgi:hypothetical protein
VARRIPDGADLASRAGAAFTDAFNVTSRVAVAVAVTAAGVVAFVFSRRSEVAASADRPETSTPPIAADLAPEVSS